MAYAGALQERTLQGSRHRGTLELPSRRTIGDPRSLGGGPLVWKSFLEAARTKLPLPVYRRLYLAGSSPETYGLGDSELDHIWERYDLDGVEETFLGESGLGDLEGFKFKKIFKAVAKVARVAVRLVPGAVAGFVTGGPVGAVVGAVAGYGPAKKAGGHGLSLKGSYILKSVGFGAGAGLAATFVAGTLTTLAPTAMAGVGYFPGLSTGLVPGISSTAFGAGAKTIGAITRIGGLLMGRPSVQASGEQVLAKASAPPSVLRDVAQFVQPAVSAYGMYNQAEFAKLQASTPALDTTGMPGAQYTGAVISGDGFAPAGAEITPGIGGLFGIPWIYIALGGGSLLFLYLSTRPQTALAKNPRRRRY